MALSPSQLGDVPRILLRTPAQLAAAIPYLVGFCPVESLVLIGLAGESSSKVVVTMRVDLPARAYCHEAALAVVGYLTVAGADTAMLVVVTEHTDPRPRQDVLDALDAALEGAGVAVTEILLLRAGRWRSYLCEKPSCCPPEGTAIAVADAGALAAASVYTGRVVHASREDLVASLAAAVDTDADVDVDAVCRRLLARVVGERKGRGRTRVAVESRTRLSTAVQRRAEVCVALPLPELARMAAGLTDVLVRDWALCWVDGDLEHAAESLWVEMTRRVSGLLVAAPATLLAVHAYLRGDGVYARIALDRALDADPAYSFAGLLSEGLDKGIPPTALRAAVTAARSLA